MNQQKQFCMVRETDYTNEEEIKAILQKGISAETILSSCNLIRKKENGVVLKLPSDIDFLRFDKIDELKDIQKAVDWIKHQNTNLLSECIEKAGDIPLLLPVSGAFSLLVAVAGSDFLFRNLKKSQPLLLQAIKELNVITAKRVINAIQCGVKLISFSDPSALTEVIGEKMVIQYSVEPTYEWMKLIAPSLTNSIVHICPRLSFLLEKEQLCQTEMYQCCGESLSFELLSLGKRKEIAFTGHVCIHAKQCQKITILK